MNIEKGQIFEQQGKKYMILEDVTFNDVKYLFTNEIINNGDEISENYFMYKVVNNEIVEENDAETINKIFPLVQKKLIDDLKTLEKEG